MTTMTRRIASKTSGLVLAATLSVASVVGCGPSSQVRAHLDAGRITEAARAAGDDPLSLEAVALEVLQQGLEEGTTGHAAAMGLASAEGFARETLEEALGSADGDASCRAAALLARLGADVGARLDACLASESPESRAAAIGAVAARDRSSDRGALGRALSDPAPKVRRAAAAAVGNLRDAAVAAELLTDVAGSDADSGVRGAALRSLGIAGALEAVLAAAPTALEAGETSLRLAAVSALGSLGDNQDASRLLALSAGGEDVVAARAAALLAATDDAAGLAAIGRLVRSPDEEVAATAAIGASAVAEAMRQPLLEALDRSEPEVRLRAAAALRGVEPVPARGILSDLLTEPGLVGIGAALLLADDRPVALAHLEETLESGEPAHRSYVAGMSTTLGRGLSLARRALADAEPTVRVAAASSVLRILARSR